MSPIATLGIVAGLAYALSLFLPTDSGAVGWVHELVPILVPLGAAVACFRASLRASSRARTSWLLFGMGAAAWAAGDIGFTILDRLGSDPAGLTWADAGYLAVIPAWGVAITLHPSHRRDRMEMLGSAVEAVVVLIGASSVTTAYVLVPIVRSGGDLAGTLVNVVYPVGDLILVAAVVALLARSAELRWWSAESFIAVAVVTFAVGDILYARLALTDSYETGSPVDLTWIAAFVLLGFASRRELEEEQRSPYDVRSRFPVLSMAGILAFVVLGALSFFSHGIVRTVLIVGTVYTGLLILARQAIMLDERRRLVRALADSVSELEALHRARDDFLATISHDLRAPLSAIRGFTNLLRGKVSEDPALVVESAETINRNTERLRRLVEDLLVTAQFSEGHGPVVKPEPVELYSLADEAVRDLGTADARITGEPVIAYADPGRVQQIVVNLVTNAVAHGGGQVRVNVGTSGGHAFLAVSDDGPGVPEEQHEAIFERFTFFSGARASVGLGLYTVRMLSRAMGGDATVRSQPGHGATFEITLPLAPS